MRRANAKGGKALVQARSSLPFPASNREVPCRYLVLVGARTFNHCFPPVSYTPRLQTLLYAVKSTHCDFRHAIRYFPAMKPLIVRDEYQLDSRLGGGSYGEVYLGISISFNKHDKTTNSCRP
jgi:hypothetical protein